MAGIKDTFSKGLTTLNVKTSNFMEENKQKTFISTKEQEIEKIKYSIGEKVCANWGKEDFSLKDLAADMEEIFKKQEAIEEAKKQIEEMLAKEKEILGATDNAVKGDVIYCGECGAANKAGNKFCEKCGNKLIVEE